MERGSTKHGPVRDHEMAHEVAGMTRGTPQPARSEEWRQTEPMDGADPAVVRSERAISDPAGHDIELRSELARILTRGAFPAGREALIGILADADASRDLIERVSLLPGGLQFASAHEVLEALGISSPETLQDE